MTSSKKILSNRQNAKRSTGPKSHNGKLRASRNALAHGLSIPISYSRGLSSQCKDLAQALSDDTIAEPHLAHDFASALIGLSRAREAEAKLLRETFKDRWLINGAEDVPHALKMLKAIKRYRLEARAQLRRFFRTNLMG